MWKELIQAQYPAFSSDSLKVVRGEVPAHLEGRLFRNQPGLLAVDRDNKIPHWFTGNGAILSLTFHNGNCSSKFESIQTPKLKYIKENHQCEPGLLKKVFQFLTRSSLNQNPANTSVYPIPNSPHLLALCQGGNPFVLTKDTLESIAFDDFKSIVNGYSAHPKVDPDTGFVYNTGMGHSPLELHMYKHTSDLKLLATNKIALRDYQSIHDVALAGDYLLFFQCPLTFSGKDFIKGHNYFHCLKYDPEKYNTRVHVFAKDDLKYINQFDAPPFMMYHFINGFSKGTEITVEFIKYDNESTHKLFEFLFGIGDLVYNKQTNFKPWMNEITRLTLDLEDKTLKFEGFPDKHTSEFPVVSEQDVGKSWKYSYQSLSTSGQNFDSIGIYDHQTHSYCKVLNFGEDSNVSQPVLIQQSGNKYLLPIVFDGRQNKSFATLLSAVDLSEICVLELPGIVPSSFHGKWDSSLLKA